MSIFSLQTPEFIVEKLDVFSPASRLVIKRVIFVWISLFLRISQSDSRIKSLLEVDASCKKTTIELMALFSNGFKCMEIVYYRFAKTESKFWSLRLQYVIFGASQEDESW